MKLHRTNQGSNFLRGIFSNRNDVRAPIWLYGQFCNVASWKEGSFGDQLWKSILLQKREASDENWIELDKGKWSEFSTMDVINEWPLLLLVSSISLLLIWLISVFFIASKETVCRAKIETFWWASIKSLKTCW